MARYDDKHKEASRMSILEHAASRFRKDGIEAVGLRSLMTQAGMTHGAFYAHFPSKGKLVAEALDTMFADARRLGQELDDVIAAEGADVRPALRRYLKGYLSTTHRDAPERGCPLPSLAADMSRSNSDAQAKFALGLKMMTYRLESAFERMGIPDVAQEARSTVAQMVGALALARAYGSEQQSAAMLRSAFGSLVSKLGL